MTIKDLDALGLRECPRCKASIAPVVVSECNPNAVRLARGGDYTTCTICERVLRFIAPELSLREPTEKEYIALVEDAPAWERILMKRRATAEAKAFLEDFFRSLRR